MNKPFGGGDPQPTRTCEIADFKRDKDSQGHEGSSKFAKAS